MYSNTIPLIENICRTCMGAEEPSSYTSPERQTSKALFSILNEPQEFMQFGNLTIMELLKQTIPQLTVEVDDVLPKNVCKVCLDKLLNMHEFQQKCLQAEHKLMELIRENTDITQIVDKEVDDPLTNNHKPDTFTDFRKIFKIEIDEPLTDSKIQENNEVSSNADNSYYGKRNKWNGNSDEDVPHAPSKPSSCQRSLRNKKKCDKNSWIVPMGITDHNFLGADDEKQIPAGDKLYKCDQCGRNLKTRKGLKRHEKIHMPLDTSKKELRNRNVEIHYEDDESYDNENWQSNRKAINNRYEVPKDTETDLEQFPCDIQPASREENEIPCDQCNSRFKSQKCLKIHLRNHLSASSTNQQIENENEWDTGSSSSSDDINYNSHRESTDTKMRLNNTDIDKDIEAHEQVEKDACRIEKNENLHNLYEETSENKEKPYVCDECGSRLKTRKSLKRHKRIHLRLPGAKAERSKTKHVCEYCQKVFCQSSSLKDHLRVHTGEQPYLCSECGKAFTSLSNMKQHFLRHGTARPYECPDCPKKFPCHSDLASHKAVHSKAKTHVCDICGAGFVKPYLLKKHKMYHTGEKNHKCDYCEMRFVLADQCRRHMRTHTGEKPYKCKYCVRAFAQSNDLIKHLRGHLGDNVYKCDLCPKGFRLQGELRTHFNTHKNDDDETRLSNLQALKEEELRLQMKFSATSTSDDV